jgi:hypothetical protein
MHEIMDKSFIWAQNLVLYLIRSGLQFLSCYKATPLTELEHPLCVSVAHNFFAYLRSSNDEISKSLDGQDRFHIQHHDASLEQIAESQEKNTEDSDLKELPRSSNISKKDKAEWDFILVSSSGGPPEPGRHVSLNFILCLSSITHQ